MLDHYRYLLIEWVKKETNGKWRELWGMTSQLQVLDVLVNNPFKYPLKKQFRKYYCGRDMNI